MRKVLLFIVLLIGQYGIAQEFVPPTDWQVDGLKGRVKERVLVRSSCSKMSIGNTTSVRIFGGSFELTTYDEQGYITSKRNERYTESIGCREFRPREYCPYIGVERRIIELGGSEHVETKQVWISPTEYILNNKYGKEEVRVSIRENSNNTIDLEKNEVDKFGNPTLVRYSIDDDLWCSYTRYIYKYYYFLPTSEDDILEDKYMWFRAYRSSTPKSLCTELDREEGYAKFIEEYTRPNKAIYKKQEEESKYTKFSRDHITYYKSIYKKTDKEDSIYSKFKNDYARYYKLMEDKSDKEDSRYERGIIHITPN